MTNNKNVLHVKSDTLNKFVIVCNKYNKKLKS